MSSTLTPAGWVVDKDVVDERNSIPRLTGVQIVDLNAKIAAGSNDYPVGTKVIRIDDGVVLTAEGLGAGVAFVPPGQAATLAALAATTGASLVGFKQSGTGAVSRTVADELRDTVSANDYSTLDQAFAAGAKGVIIPGDYNPATKIVNAANGYPLIDLRHKFVGVFSEIAPAYPADAYPFGHDMVVRARGSADTYIEHFHVTATTTTSLVVGANLNVPISAVVCGNNRFPAGSGTGGAEMFSTSAQLVLGRETANEEQVNAGSWSYVDATHINITCTKTHSGTTDIDQGGSTLLNSADLYIGSNQVKPSQNTTYDAPLRLKDLGGRYIAKIPSNINNSFPYQAWQWGCIQTGAAGGNSDLIFQNLLTTSKVVYRNNAGSDIATLNDTGNFSVVAGVATGINNIPVNGSLGELRIGRVAAAISSTTDAFAAWQQNTDPLNSTATAGGLLLASRNVASTSINFATQNTLRAAITSAGLRVVAGLGCNGKTPQSAVTVNPAATDAATTMALVNQLRAALIANGICV